MIDGRINLPSFNEGLGAGREAADDSGPTGRSGLTRPCASGKSRARSRAGSGEAGKEAIVGQSQSTSKGYSLRPLDNGISESFRAPQQSQTLLAANFRSLITGKSSLFRHDRPHERTEKVFLFPLLFFVFP